MPPEPGRPRRRVSVPGRMRGFRPSLRLRFALTAAALAAAAFSIGGAIALTFYHDSLVANVEDSGLTTAQTIAAGARDGPLPDPIPMPVGAGVPRVQILGPDGKVLSGDPASVKDSALRPPLPVTGPSRQVTTVTGSAYLPEHRAALAAVRTTGPEGPVTVIVAQSLDGADTRTSQAVELSSAIGAGSLVMVAVVAWLAVGRTLRRVEILRAQVSDVTASGDLARRVPVPGKDELTRLGATLNDLLAALERSGERQRRFIADAAHELRTPIAGLSAGIEVAARHPHVARDDDWLGELGEGHRRLARLVQDLLVLAGLDEHAPRRHHPVQLAGLVIDAARRRTPAGVRLSHGPVEQAVVLGDETQLQRVIANVLDNALRHARSQVRIALTTSDGHAVFSVADDGPGIAPADRERVWERFTRLDDGRSRPDGGSGLGLALVKELVETHGGTASITDTGQGPGALFLVQIPLRPRDHQVTSG